MRARWRRSAICSVVVRRFASSVKVHDVTSGRCVDVAHVGAGLVPALLDCQQGHCRGSRATGEAESNTPWHTAAVVARCARFFAPLRMTSRWE